MEGRRRKIIMAASAVLTAAALAIAGIFLFSGGRPPARVRPPAGPRAPSAAPLISPFTGEPVHALGPVLAVKIDNIVLARPQTGLTGADIVYVLPVEGGLSRFLAVFSSHLPPVIGPVRSAREDDLELLRQFGRPAFAYSGAAPHLLPFIHRARIVDLYAGLAGGYYRSAARVAPYNLYARPAQLVAEAHGQRPPYAVSTGSGTGVVLRDGRACDVRWSRPSADSGTRFTTASGQPMTFARGPVWIVLAARP
jgi:hypothetical protein